MSRRHPAGSPPARTLSCALPVLLCIPLILAACTRPDAPAVAAAASAPPALPAAGPQVLLAEPRGADAAWQRIDPATGQATALGVSSAPVELWALDDDRGEFYFRSSQAVWRDSWRSSDAPATQVAPLPPLAGLLHAAWVDATDGGLRVLEMREPPPAEARRMHPEPPDARPYLALVWAWRDGAWVQVAQRPTAWGADGAVGPAVADDLRHERGRSARRVDESAACATLCDHEAAAPAGVASDTTEDWRVLPGSGGRVRFGVALGDTWQPVGPVTLDDAGGAARMLWPADPAGLRLHLDGHRLMVAPTGLPAAASVIDLGTNTQRSLPASLTPPVWVE